MTQSKISKKQVIDKFKTHEGDTGSPEVQVALLSLLSMINKRRRLLHYLMRKTPERYKDIIGKIGLPK